MYNMFLETSGFTQNVTHTAKYIFSCHDMNKTQENRFNKAKFWQSNTYNNN